MLNGQISKCFKVSFLEERDLVNTLTNDVVYVRNHPFVYLKTDDENKWKKYRKVYFEKSDPRYNLDKLSNLDESYLFKLDSSFDLNSAPAKDGDMIYRSGDKYMYIKDVINGHTTYKEVQKF